MAKNNAATTPPLDTLKTERRSTQQWTSPTSPMSKLENYVHDNLEGSDNNNKLNDDALRLSQKKMEDIQKAARQREEELNQLLQNQNQRNEQGK